LLVDHGANVAARNSFALKTAACRGDLESMELLIEHGADIKTVNIPTVAQCNQLNAIKLLYKYGANIHMNNNFALTKAWINRFDKMEEFLRTH